MSDLIFLGRSTPAQDAALLIALEKAHAELAASRRISAWCPDCDRETKHTRISPTCRECTVCGELSADIVSVPCSDSVPA
jgi:ribosomal protein L37AE/L43A